MKLAKPYAKSNELKLKILSNQGKAPEKISTIRPIRKQILTEP